MCCFLSAGTDSFSKSATEAEHAVLRGPVLVLPLLSRRLCSSVVWYILTKHNKKHVPSVKENISSCVSSFIFKPLLLVSGLILHR